MRIVERTVAVEVLDDVEVAEDGGALFESARAQMQEVVRGHGLAVPAVGFVAHGEDAVAAGAAVHQRADIPLAHVVAAEQYIIVAFLFGEAELTVQLHAEINADAAGVFLRQRAHGALVVRLARFGHAGEGVHILRGVVGKAEGAKAQRKGALHLRAGRVAAVGKVRMGVGIGQYAHKHPPSLPAYHRNSLKSAHFSLIY